MVSLTALLTALAISEEHGDATAAIHALRLGEDEAARIDGLQHLLLRRLAGLPHEAALQEALGLGFLAARADHRASPVRPEQTTFLMDEHLVVRGAVGDGMLRVPWLAQDMFVERTLADVNEIPLHVREAALRNYGEILAGGERRTWSFSTYGYRFDVDSQPVAGPEGRPVAVLAVCNLVQDPADAVRSLSAREREVLQLAADGLSGPQIAEALILSETTIKTHFQNIYAKCGVSDRAAAVAKALRGGVIV